MSVSDILQKRRLVNDQQLALAESRGGGRRIDKVLVEMGVLREDDVLAALGEEFGIPVVDVGKHTIDAELLGRFPVSAMFRHAAAPLHRRDGRVVVAISDPFDLEALDELSAHSGEELEPALAPRDQIMRLIKDHLGVGGDTIDQLVAQSDAPESLQPAVEGGDVEELAQTASVIRLVNELLAEALQQRASDIHIEPQDEGLTIRYRIDGMLWVQPVSAEIRNFYSAIVTRLKIMSRLNIAEKRMPQDGRIKLRLQGREVDVRVSVIPSLYGEAVVLRLLDKQRMTFELQSIGMPEATAERFRQLIALPYGIVLVSGPTGHGKTTTIYSALNAIKSPATKIVTIEDPIEYQSSGVIQVQVHSKIGLDFATGLRSILRHDPDVILIGEIRDRETAEIAIQSSLTGHLVFSTLHSNDAASSFTRLVDMGIEPYLVASTLAGVFAQRLVRILCGGCRQAYAPIADELPNDFRWDGVQQLWAPKGCPECRGTGFVGRSGIYELLLADAELRRLVVQQATAAAIGDYANQHGLQTLRQCGFEKVRNGETSLEEVLRITKAEVV